MKLCDTFRELAYRTWGLLAEGRLHSVQLGEETLTDLNTLTLRSHHTIEVRTHLFDKRQEREVGADWEWWFTGPSGRWFGFRVQAKVIDYRSNQFKHLHYKPRRSRRWQCDNLIESCNVAQPRPVPIYCLYSQWEPGAVEIPLHTTAGKCAVEFFGCALVSALVVRGLCGTKRSPSRCGLNDVIPHAVPWHLLVCPSGSEAQDLPTQVCQRWRTDMLQVENTFLSSLDGRFRRHLLQKRQEQQQIITSDESPSYIWKIERGEEPNELPSVRRVVIFRQHPS